MDLWQKTLEEIRTQISAPSFETWFSSTTIEIEDDVLIVNAANSFSADWLESRYKTLIFEAVREVAGHSYDIEFTSPELKSTPFIGTSYNCTVELESLKSTLEEHSELIKKQQEKIEELEKRVHQLESPTNQEM